MELKFGKFKGKSIEDVAQSEEGFNYLIWLKKNTDPNDAKYGKQNQALLAEISKHTKDRVIYERDNSQLPKDKNAQGNFSGITLATLNEKLDIIISNQKAAAEGLPF